MAERRLGAIALALGLAACGGGGSGAGGNPPAPPAAPAALTVAEVERIVAQAAAEAGARNAGAIIAVVDRVGNVLATFAMPGAPGTVRIGPEFAGEGGLQVRSAVVPATLAAISKAVTGAFLSSGGNAFSTRTAGQIIQEHFNPNESQQPSGPLYGVQFSQLACSDVNRGLAPQPAPLGLAADPGGLPLYKEGVLVGGIGIELDGAYGIDRDLTDIDQHPEELVAVAGGSGFAAPVDIRGDRITADGRTFRYVDSQSLRTDPAAAPAFAALPGMLVAVPGFSTAAVRAGAPFGTPASGVRPDTGAFAGRGGWILVDAANANRYPPRAAADGRLAAADVQALLDAALAVARRARGQIRRPLGSFAQVTIAVVDREGDILGLVGTGDAPMFGLDVAVQKARTAMFFSHPEAAADLAAAAPVQYLDLPGFFTLDAYAAALAGFTGKPGALAGAVAWSARAIGNLHRPTFPDGIDGTPAGPLSKPFGAWSPFNTGLQLDLVNNQVVRTVLGDTSEGCAGRRAIQSDPSVPDGGIRRLRNGIQVFPGGVPIYRDGELAGAIGVSGDGVDQDDMVAYLGIANAAAARGGAFGHAPPAMRADTLAPLGTRLRYVQCPQAPFLDSSTQAACDD